MGVRGFLYESISGERDKGVKKIEIIIKGESGSGKTTLALALEKFLKENDFIDVEVKDFDIANGCHNPYSQDDRLNNIKNREIIIETVQIHRIVCKKET